MKYISRKYGIIKKMTSGTLFNQREIVLVPFPYSDYVRGNKKGLHLFYQIESIIQRITKYFVV
jgi:hypothetical protein